jgi:hypothetical protein
MYSLAGSGIPKGSAQIGGFPGDIREAAHDAHDWIREKMGLTPSPPPDLRRVFQYAPLIRPFMDALAVAPTSQQVADGIQTLTGGFYEPKTNAGKYGSAIGEHLPYLVLTRGAHAVPFGMALGAGLLSEFLGQQTEGTPWESIARIGGGTLGEVGVAAALALAKKGLPRLPASVGRTPRMRPHNSNLAEEAKEAVLTSTAVEFGRDRMRPRARNNYDDNQEADDQ